MQLIGEKVQHSVFGAGVVTAIQSGTLTVKFADCQKMFLYPDAFTNFLVLDNQDLQKEILSVIEVREEKAHKQEMIEEAKWRKEANLKNMRISSRSQADFDIAPQNVQECFQSWSVSTGTYASGYSKGEPRIPDRMKPNSMCLLTVRPEGKPEAERIITGLFMTEDTFEGKECEEGIINAHPEYRRQLNENQCLKFWPFVTEEENKKKWGNTTLKYLPNTTGEQILSKVRTVLKETDQGPLAEEFYQYYCRLNRLQPTKIGK